MEVAPVILPHLKDRPLTLKRYPNGIHGKHFYEKNAPAHKPEWIKTFPVERTRPRRKDRDINYILLNDAATLAWIVDISDIEMHAFLAKAPNLQRPTSVVFDLDPGPPAGIVECCEIALQIRSLFTTLELETFVKVSGSKGLHIYVPLNTEVTYEVTKPLAKAVA